MTTPTAPTWAAEHGVTYRQLDYWTRQGWLRTSERLRDASGHRRVWPPREQRVAALMGRLVAVGLAPPVAANVARSAVVGRMPVSIRIGPGISVSIRS